MATRQDLPFPNGVDLSHFSSVQFSSIGEKKTKYLLSIVLDRLQLKFYGRNLSTTCKCADRNRAIFPYRTGQKKERGKREKEREKERERGAGDINKSDKSL
jgi:hypothetical protein